MKLQDHPPLHLTYCLNIHPGETWAESFAAIRDKALRVRELVAPVRPFGLGLRLSRLAAGQLAEPAALDAFKDFLARQDLYVFTINGFPYGRFHGAAVKEDVYRPDWQTDERRDYTNLLADILAKLGTLPIFPKQAGVCSEATGGKTGSVPSFAGSISTVPGSYRQWITSDEQMQTLVHRLAECAAHLAGIERQTGCRLTIGLEPEPDCLIETTDETIAFFEGPLLTHGVPHLRSSFGVCAIEAEQILRRHLGVCFDTCHLAVQFEDLSDSLRRLIQRGIVVSKIQLSAALRAPLNDATVRQLAAFCDPVYLHQIKTRGRDGRVHSYADLPPALEAPARSEEVEARIHFHVPLFFEGEGELLSTSDSFTPEFVDDLLRGASEHLEIETYTFNVLPKALRPADVTESIAKEYAWVLSSLLQVQR